MQSQLHFQTQRQTSTFAPPSTFYFSKGTLHFCSGSQLEDRLETVSPRPLEHIQEEGGTDESVTALCP